MEASREGHLDMVALLLEHGKTKRRFCFNLTSVLHVCCFVISAVFCYTLGADIHAQTEETQETALSLACCGGFQDVAAFLLQAGIIHEDSFPLLTEQCC